MQDLGTLGGDNGGAESINNAGMIVGEADLPGSQTHDAFLWTKISGIKDLGTQDGGPCSHAISINSSGQIVSGSSDCSNFLHVFLWEKGGPMIDLNSFLPPGSNLTLTEATYISDNGEISVQAELSNGDNHAGLLIPCDGNGNGCEDSSRAGASSSNPGVRGRLERYGPPRQSNPRNPFIK